ncbi:hypothetical protein P154DRAFT_616154 [Amniculicola lignicola CBS 123094]|uniref:Uncharacterized protein n=1 Tax=Amniculicola lignicola CBS 123094 TaxID=1392246 RepID=A0A6A5X2L2_9PLEO|nr:hypothetical protein P154DRAFT_616154 [Amniculicola lignicola CBS 123094]
MRKSWVRSLGRSSKTKPPAAPLPTTPTPSPSANSSKPKRTAAQHTTPAASSPPSPTSGSTTSLHRETRPIIPIDSIPSVGTVTSASAQSHNTATTVPTQSSQTTHSSSAEKASKARKAFLNLKSVFSRKPKRTDPIPVPSTFHLDPVLSPPLIDADAQKALDEFGWSYEKRIAAVEKEERRRREEEQRKWGHAAQWRRELSCDSRRPIHSRASSRGSRRGADWFGSHDIRNTQRQLSSKDLSQPLPLPSLPERSPVREASHHQLIQVHIAEGLGTAVTKDLAQDALHSQEIIKGNVASTTSTSVEHAATPNMEGLTRRVLEPPVEQLCASIVA